jgi:hypothetical protein
VSRLRYIYIYIYSSTIASIVLLGTWAGNFHHFKVRNNVSAAKGATTTRLLNPHVLRDCPQIASFAFCNGNASCFRAAPSTSSRSSCFRTAPGIPGASASVSCMVRQIAAMITAIVLCQAGKRAGPPRSPRMDWRCKRSCVMHEPAKTFLL